MLPYVVKEELPITVKPTGKIELNARTALEDILKAAAGKNKQRPVILDMRDVSHMDPFMAMEIRLAAEDAKANCGTLVLLGPLQPLVDEVARVFEFSTLLKNYTNE